MMKSIQLAAVTAAISALFLLPADAGADDSAASLVKKTVDALPKVPVQAKLKLTPPEQPPREVALSSKMVGGKRASYLEVTEPAALQGIRFLFLENPGGAAEQYMKIAMAPNAVKVSGQVRKNPFLESDFYVYDMVEPDVGDFEYEFIGEGGIGGRAVKKIKATPKDPENAVYGSMILSIDPKDLIVIKREFTDKKGKPFKEWTVDVLEEVDGVLTIRDQHMKNLQNDTVSRLETVEVLYNGEIPDSTFTPEHLRR